MDSMNMDKEMNKICIFLSFPLLTAIVQLGHNCIRKLNSNGNINNAEACHAIAACAMCTVHILTYFFFAEFISCHVCGCVTPIADYIRWLCSIYFGNEEKHERIAKRHAIKCAVPNLISISFNEEHFEEIATYTHAAAHRRHIYPGFFIIWLFSILIVSVIRYILWCFSNLFHNLCIRISIRRIKVKRMGTFLFEFARFVSTFSVGTLCGKVFIDLIPPILILFIYFFPRFSTFQLQFNKH